jgi:hypothetical protein
MRRTTRTLKRIGFAGRYRSTRITRCDRRKRAACASADATPSKDFRVETTSPSSVGVPGPSSSSNSNLLTCKRLQHPWAGGENPIEPRSDLPLDLRDDNLERLARQTGLPGSALIPDTTGAVVATLAFTPHSCPGRSVRLPDPS